MLSEMRLVRRYTVVVWVTAIIFLVLIAHQASLAYYKATVTTLLHDAESQEQSSIDVSPNQRYVSDDQKLLPDPTLNGTEARNISGDDVLTLNETVKENEIHNRTKRDELHEEIQVVGDNNTTKEHPLQNKKKSKKKKPIAKFPEDGCPKKHAVTIVSELKFDQMMFEYANLISFCHLKDYVPLLHPKMYKRFRRYFKHISAESVDTFKNCTYEIDMIFTFQDITGDKAKRQIYNVMDFPKDSSYFVSQRELLLHEFQFEANIQMEVAEFLGNMSLKFKPQTYIAFHIKRLEWQEELEEISDNFFEKSLKLMIDRYPEVAFVVITDDAAWTKKELGSVTEPVAYAEDHSPLFEMALMAACNHSIITVGSTGFWGAFLSGGDVVYPVDYEDEDALEIQHIRKHKLKNWTPISVK